MNRPTLALLYCALAAPVVAQPVFDRAAGTYGAVNDPATGCATNPHLLEFSTNPPHALFTWQHPMLDPDEGPTRSARYDITGADEGSISLRREGSALRTDAGGPVIWVLRLTRNPQGYCWGRTDKPSVFCERPQERCDATAPVS